MLFLFVLILLFDLLLQLVEERLNWIVLIPDVCVVLNMFFLRQFSVRNGRGLLRIHGHVSGWQTLSAYIAASFS